MQLNSTYVKSTLLISVILVLISCSRRNEPELIFETIVFCSNIESQIEENRITSIFPPEFRITKKLISKGHLFITGFVDESLFQLRDGMKTSSILEVEIEIESLNYEARETEIELRDYRWPCETCDFLVTHLSPNSDYILAESIHSSSLGLWLIGKETYSRLIDNVPNAYDASWSSDGNSVFIKYSLPNLGRSVVFSKSLKNQIVTLRESDLEKHFPNQNFDNIYTEFEFDPVDEKVWWFKRFSNEAVIYDPDVDSIQNYSDEYFTKVEWQPALNSLMVVTQNEKEVFMKSQDKKHAISISEDVAQIVFDFRLSDDLSIVNVLDQKSYFDKEMNRLYVKAGGIIYQINCSVD